MALNLPQNFKNDIAGRDTNLVPVVVIGNFPDAGQQWNKISVLSTNVLSINIFTGFTGVQDNELL